MTSVVMMRLEFVNCSSIEENSVSHLTGVKTKHKIKPFRDSLSTKISDTLNGQVMFCCLTSDIQTSSLFGVH